MSYDGSSTQCLTVIIAECKVVEVLLADPMYHAVQCCGHSSNLVAGSYPACAMDICPCFCVFSCDAPTLHPSVRTAYINKELEHF